MGLPLPSAANPTNGNPPNVADLANAVVTGQFTAVGQTSQPFVFYGKFNVVMWSSLTTSLVVTAGSANASVGSGTGLAAGQSITSTKVPPGATVGAISTTSLTLGGLTTAQISALAAGTDAAALFTGSGSEASGTVNFECTYDGGATWLPVSTDEIGTAGVYQFGSGHLTYPVSIQFDGSAERGVGYRLNVAVLSSGKINYRISATGPGATTWAPP